MSATPAIVQTVDANIARLTITSPSRKNAMTLAMWQALPDLVAACEADPGVRAIVLTGAGDTFCAGADISEFGELRSDAAGARLYEESVSRANAALLHASKPTIALVRGSCYGGGVGLALACDLRFASSEARFRIPAAKLSLGYSYDNVELVISRIGYAAAADLLFCARVFDAEQAKADGLVRDVFAAGSFAEETERVVATIGANAPLTMLAVKKAMVAMMRHASSASPPDVAEAVARCFTSQDYAEGRQAFAQRREPRFIGR